MSAGRGASEHAIRLQPTGRLPRYRLDPDRMRNVSPAAVRLPCSKVLDLESNFRGVCESSAIVISVILKRLIVFRQLRSCQTLRLPGGVAIIDPPSAFDASCIERKLTSS